MPDGDLVLTDDEFASIKTLTKSSISDGAPFLPFSPLDLTSFDPSTQKLEVVFNWEIADSIENKDGSYFMQNRVSYTPFDFDVTLRIAIFVGH